VGVAVAKGMPDTPVKVIWSRTDDTRNDVYRPPSLHVARAVLDGKRVRALTHKMIGPSITSRVFPGVVKDGVDPFMTEGTANFTYEIPNLEMRTVIQEIGIRVGYWRSVSHALNAFAVESFVDELAHAAGVDPLAFRLAMLQQQPRQRAVVELAAKRAGYRAAKRGGRAFGIAAMECYDTHIALIAEVSARAAEIKLERLTFALDCGIQVHPDQIIAQLQGGAISGLIGAVRAKVTLTNGRVEQDNFDTFPIPTLADVPPIDVVTIKSDAKPGGVGETGVPLIAPALANAVFALTGKRLRSLPLEDAGVHFV
jgi:isoquinoline 1-oxidoreductase beta subunit